MFVKVDLSRLVVGIADRNTSSTSRAATGARETRPHTNQEAVVLFK